MQIFQRDSKIDELIEQRSVANSALFPATDRKNNFSKNSGFDYGVKDMNSLERQPNRFKRSYDSEKALNAGVLPELAHVAVPAAMEKSPEDTDALILGRNKQTIRVKNNNLRKTLKA